MKLDRNRLKKPHSEFVSEIIEKLSNKVKKIRFRQVLCKFTKIFSLLRRTERFFIDPIF